MGWELYAHPYEPMPHAYLILRSMTCSCFLEGSGNRGRHSFLARSQANSRRVLLSYMIAKTHYTISVNT